MEDQNAPPNTSFKGILSWDFQAREHFSQTLTQMILRYPLDPHLSEDELHNKFLSYKADADIGLGYAQFQLGECYRLGRGTISAAKKAIQYYNLAIENENVDAMLALAKMYSLGIGVVQSKEKAFHLYMLAAQANNNIGQFLVGISFYYGDGTKQSIEEAIHYFQISAKNGHYAAYRRLALIYLKGIDVTSSKELAKEYFQKFLIAHQQRANAGYTDSMVWVGNCYQYGEGVDINLETAFSYYKKAANKNYAWGLACLAKCYERGIGTIKSIDQAINYFKLAVKYGENDAIYDLARILEEDKQYEESLSYWKAVSQGIFDQQEKGQAEYHLGDFYKDGHGVIQSFKNAFYYYLRSAEKGNLDAIVAIGKLYRNGKGVIQSYTKAFELFQKAAQQGHSYALVLVGDCYQSGYGAPRSMSQAIDYYLRAAACQEDRANFELGIIYSEMNKNELADEYFRKWIKICKCWALEGKGWAFSRLGDCYKIGYGVKVDYVQAFHYYQLAAQHNALYNSEIANCFEFGIGIPICIELSICYYKLALEAGDINSILDLARLLDQQDRCFEAVEYWKKAAQCFCCCQHTRLMAQYNLAKCYATGRGVTKSNKTALYYYSISAAEGLVQSQLELATAYLEGLLGLEISIDQSIYYYNLALNLTPRNTELYNKFRSEITLLKTQNLAMKFIYYNIRSNQNAKAV